MIERTYTIPLRRGFINSAKYRKTNRAVSTLRNFLVKHMKAEEKNVKLGQNLNDLLWRNGIKNPPAKVTVNVKKGDDGIVFAELLGFEYKGTVKPLAKAEEATGLKEKLSSALGKKETTEPKIKDENPKEIKHKDAKAKDEKSESKE